MRKRPINVNTCKIIKQKSKLWKHYIQSRDPKILFLIKKIRNTVRNKTSQADRFIQNEIGKTCKNNPEHFWKYVKATTKSNKKALRETQTLRARWLYSKVRTPPARPLSQTHRQDRLQNTAPLASAQCKEPIGGLKIHTESGDKAIAEKDDRKAEVLCDFFSSVFCTENDTVFPVLSNKECDVASEPPNFDLDDIINRLNKT